MHVATIKNGVIYNAVSDTNSYNIPNKVIAERIKENSGDYFVKPFIVNFSKDLGQEQFGELLKSKISSKLND